MFTPTPLKRAIFFFIFDVILSFGTLFLAYNLRFNFHVNPTYMEKFFFVFFLLLSLKIFSLIYMRVYSISWQFVSLWDAKKILYAHFIAYISFTLIRTLFPELLEPFPRSVIIIDFALSIVFLGALRISKRLFVEREQSGKLPQALLIGVSSFSQTLLKDRGEFKVVAVLDDNEMIIDSYVGNIKVGKLDTLVTVIEEKSIDTVIVTKELEKTLLNQIYNELHELNIYDIKIISLVERDMTLKPISIEDLLARKPKDLDMITIANFIVNKVVMITGAGGSIGSELSRQVANFGAKQIILLDHSEYNLYQISEELQGSNIVSVMLSVKDRDSLDEIFKQYLPDVVIHAAAYKHVPLCEENIQSAIENNIFGTKNVIDLSIKYEVEKFVLISTDKAVRPTNVMGTTKRVCELYAHAVPSNKTEIVAVRFGNVLGSSGSVIPKFKEQIKNGKNITVTHPDITRYFMMIPEACQLVLQAGSIAKGGELFILDMGEPIKIVDLAKRMIELSGRDDIEIEFTGLRQGEKLYEELLIDDADLKTEYDSILVSQDEPVDYNILLAQIDSLKESDSLTILKEIVPEFDHKV
jgi:UDP-N-acetyl-D-glucosamine 4,6-dehydratase